MLSATFELAHPATDRSALHELLCFSSRMTVLTSLLLCHPLKLVSKVEVLTKAAAAVDAEAKLYAAQLRDLAAKSRDLEEQRQSRVAEFTEQSRGLPEQSITKQREAAEARATAARAAAALVALKSQ